MNSLNNISIQQSRKISDFLSYCFLVFKDGLAIWIWYVLLVIIFGGKSTKMIIIKENSKIIGGFFLSNFSLLSFKRYNWFDKVVKLKIKELQRNGYQYFCCFIIQKEYRNKGIGTLVFSDYFKENNNKVHFTASKKAVPFYIRNGAVVVYKSRYDVYVFDGQS